VLPEERLSAEMDSLREQVVRDRATLCKWGRMLNALLAVLGEKDVASKGEVMAKVYERLDEQKVHGE